VIFNSDYHRQSWFGALPNLLKHFPDYNHLEKIEAVQARSGTTVPARSILTVAAALAESGSLSVYPLTGAVDRRDGLRRRGQTTRLSPRLERHQRTHVEQGRPAVPPWARRYGLGGRRTVQAIEMKGPGMNDRWSPTSWQKKPIAQQVVYPDCSVLKRCWIVSPGCRRW